MTGGSGLFGGCHLVPASQIADRYLHLLNPGLKTAIILDDNRIIRHLRPCGGKPVPDVGNSFAAAPRQTRGPNVEVGCDPYHPEVRPLIALLRKRVTRPVEHNCMAIQHKVFCVDRDAIGKVVRLPVEQKFPAFLKPPEFVRRHRKMVLTAGICRPGDGAPHEMHMRKPLPRPAQQTVLADTGRTDNSNQDACFFHTLSPVTRC